MTRNGRNPKSPAYQWYPTDALTDARYAELTYEERGIFHALLDYAWLNDGIPCEPERIARLLRLSQADFDRVWVAVCRCFRAKDGDGSRLVNGRQERERQAQVDNRDTNSTKGKKGADARWGAKPDASTAPEGCQSDGPVMAGPMPGPMPGPCPAMPPDSRIPTPSRTESLSRSTRAREPDLPAQSQEPAVNVHAAFCEWWVGRYAEATASPAMPLGARYDMSPAEKSKANELLAKARANGQGIDLVRQVVERFIAHPVFGKEPATLGRILANWNTLLTVASPKPAVPPRTETQEERDLRDRWFAVHSRRFKAVPPYPATHEQARAVLEELTAPKAAKNGTHA